GLDAGKRPTKAVLQTSGRPLGCGNSMAFAAYHLQTLLARCESAEQRTDGRNSTRFSFPSNHRDWCRRMVWIWRTGRGAAGPAWWRGLFVDFRLRAFAGWNRTPGHAAGNLRGFG